MTILVRTRGTGRFTGHETSIESYQYSEGAMPKDVFDQSGEVGELSFRVNGDDDNKSILLHGDRIELQDEIYGSITGKADGFNYADGFVEISGKSRLNLINTEGVVTPEVTTVAEYLTSIFDAALISTDVIISPDIPNTPIVTPGFEGNLWVLLKQFAAFHQLDVSLIRNAIFVRPMRQREVFPENVSTEIVNLSEGSLSQKFNVAYYNYEKLVDALAFPKGGWTPDVEVYSVEANETVVFDIPVDAFLESVKQPIPQGFVSKEYSGPDSVYTITANDGLGIAPQLWTDFGGKMSFELTDLGRNIQVTLTGPTLEDLSPFSISLSDGATQYSTLRIVGTGVFFDRQTVTIPTGLTGAETPQEFGQEIDNVFISTYEQAYDAGVKARGRYALPVHTFDSTARNFSRFAEARGALAAITSFADYNLFFGLIFSFEDFAEYYEGFNFAAFNNSLSEQANQTFGATAGAKIKFEDAYYRVKNVVTSQNEISISSDFDTQFVDSDKNFGGIRLASGGEISTVSQPSYVAPFDVSTYALHEFKDTSETYFFDPGDSEILDSDFVVTRKNLFSNPVMENSFAFYEGPTSTIGNLQQTWLMPSGQVVEIPADSFQTITHVPAGIGTPLRDIKIMPVPVFVESSSLNWINFLERGKKYVLSFHVESLLGGQGFGVRVSGTTSSGGTFSFEGGRTPGNFLSSLFFTLPQDANYVEIKTVSFGNIFSIGVGRFSYFSLEQAENFRGYFDGRPIDPQLTVPSQQFLEQYWSNFFDPTSYSQLAILPTWDGAPDASPSTLTEVYRVPIVDSVVQVKTLDGPISIRYDLFRSGASTFSDWNNTFFGLKFSDHSLVPLRDRQYFDLNFFTLDESELDGPDVLGIN